MWCENWPFPGFCDTRSQLSTTFTEPKRHVRTCQARAPTSEAEYLTIISHLNISEHAQSHLYYDDKTSPRQIPNELYSFELRVNKIYVTQLFIFNIFNMALQKRLYEYSHLTERKKSGLGQLEHTGMSSVCISVPLWQIRISAYFFYAKSGYPYFIRIFCAGIYRSLYTVLQL